MSEAATLLELTRTQHVIVCVGSGGVGKTTISAAIALKAAQIGRVACVVTIDPARRLANALGVQALGNTPARVDDRLFAMMLDTKRTWDDLVHRFASSPEQAEHILANKYYRQISTATAGSQEFMAMEKLYELHESAAYDLIVLDTPPTRHALDFLDAPERMIGFMDDRLLRFLTMPARMGSSMLFTALQRITGFEVLSDIADYVNSFSGMHGGFKDRARRVQEQLRSTRSTFALVASPNADTVDEAAFFFQKLRTAAMPFGGFIVNRVQERAITTPESAADWKAIQDNPETLTGDDRVASRLIENFAAYEAMAAAHAANIARLYERCPGPYFRRVVPAFDEDVRDLNGLARINERLFAPAE